MELKGKTVVIAGATGGIGQEIMKAFSKEDSKLILVARSEEKLKTLANDDSNVEKYYICDFSDNKQTIDVAGKLSSDYDTIDVLINVAGIGVYKNIEDVELQEWEDSFSINVSAPFLFTKGLLPSLNKSEKSVVINMGSGMGKVPTGGRSVYCATKFALRGMSLSMAEEYKGTNVNIVHMTMGSILTDFGPLSLEEKKKMSLEGKGYLTPDWVAGKVATIIKEDEIDSEVEIYPSKYK